MALVIALFGFLAINAKTNEVLYALSFSRIYAIIIFLAIAFGILAVLGVFRLPTVRKKLVNALYFVFFFPLVFYPIFRCYFKIPWVFCHVCPRKCIFGYLRPYAVPGAVLMNIQQRSWCFSFCPVGKLQDEQAKCCAKKISLPKWVSWIRYLVLAAVVVAYFWILSLARKMSLTSLFLFKNVFSFSMVVLVVAVAIFIIAFFIHRFFCNYFCPVGAVGDIVLKLESKIK